MTQAQINRAVACATGESPREIARLGFSMADVADVDFDREPSDQPPAMIEWDEWESQRPGLFP
jgi:hypothetical protein